jgi:predicted acylesterase/phospholipase RssA
MEVTAREPVLVDLALQGGGSYGAFTRGVLDRLIEEPRLRIDAISGKSAGAMNAALVADGWTQKRTHRLLPLLHSAERVSASPSARRKAKGERYASFRGMREPARIPRPMRPSQ